MTGRGYLGVAGVFLAAATFARAESEGPSSVRVTPTLEWLRDAIVKRGVPPRFVRLAVELAVELEEPGDATAARLPRLVFWTRTRRLTQTVIVAVVADADAGGPPACVRIQSAGLGLAPAGHPRLVEVMAYLLDRNFAMSGAQFARDAADGEIVLRTELAAREGLSEGEFGRALDILLRAADEEAPRIEAMLGEKRPDAHNELDAGKTQRETTHGRGM